MLMNMNTAASFSTIFSVVLIACLSLSSSSSHFVDAYETFECEKVWKNASTSNDLLACLTNVTHIATLFNTTAERARIGGTLIPLALVFIVVVTFPIFLALRYCVDFCGSYKRRPGNLCYGGEEWDDVEEHIKDHFYDPCDANCTRALAYMCVVLSFVPMMLLFIGTGDIQEGYNTIFGEVFELVAWAQEKEKSITNAVQPNGTSLGSINSTFFSDMSSAVSGFQSDIEKANDVNVALIDTIKTISIVFALVPFLSLLANALFAAFDIRSCWPLLNSFFHFIFLCFYALIASACLILGVLTDRICGERDAFLANAPSIPGYFMVPRCDSSVSFAPVSAALVDAASNTSVGACTKLAYHCNTVDTYSVANSHKIWYCPLLTSATTQCPNSSTASDIFYGHNMTALSGASMTCSAGTTTCDLKGCAANCTNATHKSISSQILESEQHSSSVNSALNTFNTELGNCTALIRAAMNALKSCGTIKSSVFYVGVGSCIYSGLFIIGMVVIFRGQKRFFKPIHKKKKKKLKKHHLFSGTATLSPGNSPSSTPQTKSIEPIYDSKV